MPVQHKIDRRRFRLRRRVRGGGIIDVAYRLGKNGLETLVRRIVNGVPQYVPALKNLKNQAIDKVASFVKEKTGGRAKTHHYNQAERLRAIRGALKQHGRGLAMI